MSRPKKEGLSYFPLDIDVFQDRKVRILTARYGSDGFALYIYLLCQIFKEGYFLIADEDFDYIVSSDLNMSYEKIGQMRNFLLERSLLDSKLFQSDKVLTSVGIQRRYQQAVKKRISQSTPFVFVNQSFWLLSKEETESFIKVQPNENYSEKNPLYSAKNQNYSEKNDTKKSKVKESKVKKSKAVVEIPTLNGVYRVTEQQLQQLQQQYADIEVIKCLQRIESYMRTHADKRKSNKYMGEAYIPAWIANDLANGLYPREKIKEYGGVYDLEAYEKADPFADMEDNNED